MTTKTTTEARAMFHRAWRRRRPEKRKELPNKTEERRARTKREEEGLSFERKGGRELAIQLDGVGGGQMPPQTSTPTAPCWPIPTLKSIAEF